MFGFSYTVVISYKSGSAIDSRSVMVIVNAGAVIGLEEELLFRFNTNCKSPVIS